MHTCNKNIPNCNGFGNKNKIRDRFSTEPDNKNYYIDHFYSKSIEELINITKEKIELIEKGTGQNLAIFREMIS